MFTAGSGAARDFAREGQSPDVHWTAPFVNFRTVEIDIKHQRKILARWFLGRP